MRGSGWPWDCPNSGWTRCIPMEPWFGPKDVVVIEYMCAMKFMLVHAVHVRIFSIVYSNLGIVRNLCFWSGADPEAGSLHVCASQERHFYIEYAAAPFNGVAHCRHLNLLLGKASWDDFFACVMLKSVMRWFQTEMISAHFVSDWGFHRISISHVESILSRVPFCLL